MDDFPKTLIIAIVVSVIVVLVVFGLILYLALNWTRIVHRGRRNSWPETEKAWPQMSKSDESYYSSPVSSPRSSRMSSEPMVNNFNAYDESPITPPRNVK
ncbi:uncharacterized protein F4822DRAFT_324989 [Hypoxylon trugodes]|uniref:uncharacterized protein n=1 Tax=Hypoxylon trugodes TaxID=326681 RepID=UPI00218CFABF|nr:uncharacterized protein F4822DRAFT_324989 [Hypoxylon trugodes]KAI1386718.1 hypothetical protein F4822DRAFT_324989 [Hypoxylon trugodes]